MLFAAMESFDTEWHQHSVATHHILTTPCCLRGLLGSLAIGVCNVRDSLCCTLTLWSSLWYGVLH